ncbi:hypothetical protein L1049_015483 [Liquidambar formosana]|uniref:Uncharacterized protein n=1 Tax=Liquidambar formosana TaxID=63359 RepID=A0AAP0RXX4_LIQFO
MSLALLQGYSSAEEEEAEDDQFQYQNSSDDDGDHEPAVNGNVKSSFDFPNTSAASALPSAFAAFSEITGPPEFLNNSVEEQAPVRDSDQQQRGRWHGGRRNRKEKKDLPSGKIST